MKSVKMMRSLATGMITVVVVSVLLIFQNCSQANSDRQDSVSTTDASLTSSGQPSPTLPGVTPVPTPTPISVQNPNPADFKCGTLVSPGQALVQTNIPYISCRAAPVVANSVAKMAVQSALNKSPIDCVYVKHPADSSINLRCVWITNDLAPNTYLNPSLVFSGIYLKLKIIVTTPRAICYGQYIGTRTGFAGGVAASAMDNVEYLCETINPSEANLAVAELNAYFQNIKGGAIPNQASGLTATYSDFSLTCGLAPNHALAVPGKAHIQCSGVSIRTQQ